MNGQIQADCHSTRFTPIYILANPSFLSGAPCASTWRGIPSWYPTSTEMLTGFLSPCDNYTIPDSAYIAGSTLTQEACLFPVVPQPVPDGKGVLAFSDFGFATGGMYVNPDYKSFASTCLTAPLKKDSLYRLDFFAGFGTPGSEFLQATGQLLGPGTSPSPETFGLFGDSDCLAVGNPIPLYSCIQRAGWTSLGSVEVKGGPGTWQQVSIYFIPPFDMRAIALGPSCDTNFTSAPFTGSYNGQGYRANTYSYFIDSLQFYRTDVPPPIVSLVSGDSCTATIVLQMEPAAFYANSHLAWYRNGYFLPGEDSSIITLSRTIDTAGPYSCQVINDSICLMSNPYIVNWIPIPNPAALGNPDTTICRGDTVLLNAFTGSAFTYTWQDGSTQPYYTATQNGTYTVKIADGCGSALSQKTIHLDGCNFDAFVPNAFTPNNDGHNDVFRAHFLTPPTRFSIAIFDRNGLEVYSSADYNEGWDGAFNGIRQPAGGYIWTIRFTDIAGKPHTRTGTLVLIR